MIEDSGPGGADFEIRLAAPAEIGQLPAIERAAAARFAEVGLSELVDGPVTAIADFEAALARDLLFVAMGEERVLGFALALELGPDLHLHEMDVLPDWGRRGIGRALVGAVEAAAVSRRCPKITLITFRRVPWNGPFYARLGFEPLAPQDHGSELAELWQRERQEGFDPESRMVMAKPSSAARAEPRES